MAHGDITLSEIKSQPGTWATALSVFGRQVEQVRAFWAAGKFDQVVFTGCGSTYYLGVIGATLLQAATGVPARACSASELPCSRRRISARRGRRCWSAFRAPARPETVEWCASFGSNGAGRVLVVTRYGDSPLAASADLVLAVDAAREDSLASRPARSAA
ncbi:MAG: hypothetical protein U0703_09395 [Anaerolineae bacterium]